MSRLAEGLSRFFGRVEILARGAEEERRAAEHALARGLYLEARAEARALLARVPRSPVGLALWADAAEACWHDDEVVDALSQLVEQVPWRHEVWLRLGQAGVRSSWPHARGALERAAAAHDNPAIAREALLELADLDLGAGEARRARRWLDRVPYHPSQPDPELALRRAETALAMSRYDEALQWSERMQTLKGGRARLVRASLANHFPDREHGGDAVTLVIGALLLDTPGADELTIALTAACHDAALVDRVRTIVSTLGRLGEPRWQAAFALAEGRRADARHALVEAVESGDRDAARTLLALAITWRDLDALRAVARADKQKLPPTLRRLLEASQGEQPDDRALALLDVAAADPSEAGRWAGELLKERMRAWVPAKTEEPSRWDDILRELRRAATDLERLDAIGPLEALAIERERPLYVAVLGEFNAGKSTFINALLGTDVAPTGVMPTTASLHWVSWAPDPFARVVVLGGSDRVVSHGELKRALGELYAAGGRIDRVLIYAPIERLKRIEVLDTPGFNAPELGHADQARRGFEEAHVALWLLDATAPLKHSERLVIEEVAKAGVPIQVLVNKRDRVGEENIDQVMDYVREALEETGIASLRPPLAFSAQRALAGRLGDAAALAESRWGEVETLLEEHIVSDCDTLRERALRRKAARVSGMLLEAARQRVEQAREAQRIAGKHAEESGALAARLSAQRAPLAEAFEGELTPALTALRADARPLAQLPEERRREPELAAYLVERTVERLSPALAQAIAAHARRSGSWDDDALGNLITTVEPPIRAALAGAASAHGRQLEGPPLRAALEAALSAASEAVARDAARPPAASGEETLARRLEALHAALVD
ncbi:MAG TPA: dynamin family protein [Polyangiaceae bacterium]|nr:dynamin family protein [Polyangiaceae bacterium]